MRTMLDVVGDEFDRLAHRDDLMFMTVVVPMNISIDSKLAIVDIETTGIDANRNKIVTCGVINSNKMIIEQCYNPDFEFRDFVKGSIFDLGYRYGVERFYAFNCGFEKRFIGGGFDWREIQPYRISKDNCIHFDHYGFGVGKDVVKWWRSWKKSGNLVDLRNIVLHNSQCLLKELAIFMVNESNSVLDKA